MDRVLAEDHLPFAAVTRPIRVDSIATQPPLSESDKIRIRVDGDGLLRSEDDERLIQSIPLAVDFHSCSVFLERSPGRQDTVYLQAARPLKPGDSLQLWFSTDVQALLGISFLTPLNIRGEKNYVCHICEESFEYPNPLKVHLALNCGKQKISQLWQRLKNAFDLTNNNFRTIIPYDSILKLSLEPRPKDEDVKPCRTPPSPAHSSYSSPSPNRERLEETRPSSEPPRNSAFRPYLPLRDEICEKKGRLAAYTSDTISRKSKADNVNLTANLNRDIYMHRHAAEIETLVSNLGQSKQGHLCLYCGKIYSRKYGLKIHIRTHTGFKPLKCKYCFRPFGDPSNLNKHVRLHAESETPYRCEICGKMLVRRRDLERHLKTRHNFTF